MVKTLFVCLIYLSEEEVTGGQVIVVAKYNGVTLYDATLRLCDALYPVNVSCPVKPVAHGRAVITVTVPDLFFPVSWRTSPIICNPDAWHY